MKAFRIIGRSISSAFKSVFRNFSLSIASISCIVITLIMVSFSLILSGNVNNFTKDIENDMTIVAFVKLDATNENIDALKGNIEALPNIDESTYMSKEDMKESMKETNDAFNKIISEWEEGENPLQACFILKVKDINLIGETATTIKNLEFVDVVKYGEGMVEELVSFFDMIKKIMFVAVIALIFVTAFLISNTIKITIYSRKNEIDIMRLVGTSNFVIRMPFIFEGLFLGVFGSLIPILATIYGYVFLYDKMGGILFTDIITLIEPYNFVFYVSAVLLILGALVGMFGSYKAVRKYLKI